MIHVYALTDADSLSVLGSGGDPLLGIDDRPLESRAAGAVAAVLSRYDRAPEPTAEALLRHAAVVEALHERGAALPARFGAAVADERAVDELLAEPGLTARLDRVRDRVEIDVRLVATGADAAPESSAVRAARETGRDHLRALAARAASSGSSQQARQAAVEAVRTRLESLADAVVDRPPGSARVLRHTALLLGRVALASFGRAVVDLAAELAPEHTVLCTGPWPPYNFVEAPDPAAAAGADQAVSGQCGSGEVAR